MLLTNVPFAGESVVYRLNDRLNRPSKRARTGFIQGFDIKPIRRFEIAENRLPRHFTSTRWSNFKIQALCVSHECSHVCKSVRGDPNRYCTSKANLPLKAFVVERLWGQISIKSLLFLENVPPFSCKSAPIDGINLRDQRDPIYWIWIERSSVE